MDLGLYLATRPYDRETTAELLGRYIYEVIDTDLLFLIFKVESPDLLPVEVVETTVNEEPHIRKLNGTLINVSYFICTEADIDQIPSEHIVNVIVQINTENERKLRAFTFSLYESFLLIQVLIISQISLYLLLKLRHP